jgi:hypothetical protein
MEPQRGCVVAPGGTRLSPAVMKVYKLIGISVGANLVFAQNPGTRVWVQVGPYE